MSAGRKERTPRGRLLWTTEEDAVLRAAYPTPGVGGCLARLPDRGRGAIAQRAYKLGVCMNEEARCDLLSAVATAARRGSKIEPPSAPADVGALDAVARAWAARRERSAA